MTQIAGILSGSPDALGSAMSGFPAFTGVPGNGKVVHAVPAGEVHVIWLTFTNVGTVQQIEILFENVAEHFISLDHRMQPEESVSIGPILLDGGSTGTDMKCAVVTFQSQLRVCGRVIKQT